MLWSECDLLIEDVDYKKLAEYLGKYMKNEDIISENIEDFVFRKMKKNHKKENIQKIQKKKKREKAQDKAQENGLHPKKNPIVMKKENFWV